MKEIKQSAFHKVTDKIEKLLNSNSELLEKWNSLTDIQRNEWICWITIPKQEKTRVENLERMQAEIMEGGKSPCCWPGCPHRNPNSAKWFDKKKAKKLKSSFKLG